MVSWWEKREGQGNYLFQPDPALKFSSAIMIAIEKLIRIDRILPEKM